MEAKNEKYRQQKTLTGKILATFLFLLAAMAYVDAIVDGTLEEAASEGKLHYEVIMREAKMPK